tara:strand:+ start:3321 stop:3839 length:519 start_codon:yes stop_codon:yes gene_type:complete
MENLDSSPMSPDQLATLAALAGPLFGESRNIEKMTSENTVVGGSSVDGSSKIKAALEQAQHAVRAQRPPPTQYIPPEYIEDIQHVPQPVERVPDVELPQYIPTQPSITPNIQSVDDGQLMFSFDKKEQQITNDHLKDISDKLSKIITFLNTPKVEEPKKTKKPPHAPNARPS